MISTLKRTNLIACIFVIPLIIACVLSPSILFAKDQTYKSAVLMDYETGQVLFEDNAHESVIPASVVKMMVLLIVMEKLEAGELHLSDIVTVSAWASKIGGHQVYLAEGETFSLEELLRAIAISSANDAATAVAEFAAGDADTFVELMNIRAQELGMQNTTFANEHGLPPDPGQKENHTTAYDIALLGRELLKHPRVLAWTATIEDTFRNGTFTLTNTNRDLIRNYRGLDGLKTGFHPRGAAFSVCATAQRDDRRLIAVVMGAPQKADRTRAVREILNLGFTKFERVVALQKGFAVGDVIPVIQGKTRSARLVASENAVVFVERGKQESVRYDIELSVSQIAAPASQGSQFGEATIFVDEHPITTVDLVLGEELEKGNVVDRVKFWILDKVS